VREYLPWQDNPPNAAASRPLNWVSATLAYPCTAEYALLYQGDLTGWERPPTFPLTRRWRGRLAASGARKAATVKPASGTMRSATRVLPPAWASLHLCVLEQTSHPTPVDRASPKTVDQRHPQRDRARKAPNDATAARPPSRLPPATATIEGPLEPANRRFSRRTNVPLGVPSLVHRTTVGNGFVPHDSSAAGCVPHDNPFTATSCLAAPTAIGVQRRLSSWDRRSRPYSFAAFGVVVGPMTAWVWSLVKAATGSGVGLPGSARRPSSIRCR
jgi:hypothetical protein